ncbi:MAG TPA: recombinase family protein [Lachnospiraceae bacterium]|nr:recombinase family protein [Lachnospiraceae bacterium]
MSEKLKEVCAYIRVSTDKQEELSPESQIRLIKEYAQAHGMLLTHIYMEEHGISGKKADKRPAFQEMIASCKDKSHPYDAILLWKFSRFARNIDESTYYKSILRKKCNVDVISISEPIIEGMYGRLIEMVIEWSDEFYLYNLSGEVIRGMTQKALQGGYNSNVPIGYTKEKGNDKIPQIDPEGALIVRKIFDMYVNEKRPLSDIATLLNKDGCRTKRGGRFETRTIGYILENPFYIGKIRWNYYDRQSNQRKKTEDVIISDGKHEPLITQEVFALAGERLAQERLRTDYGKKRPVASTKHWLSGMIKCSECGSSLSYGAGSQKQKIAPHFQCWKKGKGLCDCYHGNSINEKIAIKEIIKILKELEDSNSYLEFDLSVIRNEGTEKALLQKELKNLDAKEHRIKDAYINGIDSLEEYKANKEMLSAKRSELQEKLDNANITTLPTAVRKEINFREIIALIQNENADYITKGNALRDIFEHFVWNKEKNEMRSVLNMHVKSDRKP